VKTIRVYTYIRWTVEGSEPALFNVCPHSISTFDCFFSSRELLSLFFPGTNMVRVLKNMRYNDCSFKFGSILNNRLRDSRRKVYLTFSALKYRKRPKRTTKKQKKTDILLGNLKRTELAVKSSYVKIIALYACKKSTESYDVETYTTSRR